jgi:DNA replication protein DnaT
MTWIKIATSTPDKPEVFKLSELLRIDPNEALGKLVRFWLWADGQTTDGNAASVSKALLDRITHQPGFTDALVSVGWLTQSGESFYIPNFERHNGNSAKSRALTAKRVAEHKKRGNESLTLEALHREEKIREEVNTTSTPIRKHSHRTSCQ